MQQELDKHKPGGEPSLLVPIQGAAHHMMADQPVRVISAIVVLAQWRGRGRGSSCSGALAASKSAAKTLSCWFESEPGRPKPKRFLRKPFFVVFLMRTANNKLIMR